jgi:hypothetical protein
MEVFIASDDAHYCAVMESLDRRSYITGIALTPLGRGLNFITEKTNFINVPFLSCGGLVISNIRGLQNMNSGITRGT